jgi:hypothetical protein
VFLLILKRGSSVGMIKSLWAKGRRCSVSSAKRFKSANRNVFKIKSITLKLIYFKSANRSAAILLQINSTVMLTFLCRDLDRPVTVPSPFTPFFRMPSPLRPHYIQRVQRSFSLPKRPLIYDA